MLKIHRPIKRSYLLAFSLVVIVLLSAAIIFYVYTINQPKPKFEVGDIVYPTALYSDARLADCRTGNNFHPGNTSTARTKGVEITAITLCEGWEPVRYLYEVKWFPSGRTDYGFSRWLFSTRQEAESSALEIEEYKKKQSQKE
jgi:hypothetical protein